MPTIFDLEIMEHEEFARAGHIARPKMQQDHYSSNQVFLRVRARPDFISHRHELMQSVPKVRFEVVVDPLIFGLIPKSIAGIVIFLSVVALFAYKVISQKILNTIRSTIGGKRQKIVRIKTH